MPAPSTIVINDGSATPVAHTFTPIGKDTKGVLWYEQTTPAPANPIAAKRIGYRQTRGDPMSKALDAVGKVVLTLHVPTPETVSPNSSGITASPRLAYKQVARIEFDLAERSSKAERVDTRVMAYGLLGSVMATAVIDDLQPVWGG